MGLFGKSKRFEDNRRQVERIPERNAMLVLDGVSYGVTDWSLDGFHALGYRGGYSRGAEARARLIIVHKGMPTHFDASVRILRESVEVGEIAGQFVYMSDRTRENLEQIYSERLTALLRKGQREAPA